MDRPRPTRRQLLGSIGAAVAGGGAGCSALGVGNDADPETSVTPAPVPEAQLPTGQLSVRTALGKGSCRRALADLAAAFEAGTEGVDPVVTPLAGPGRQIPEGAIVDYRRLGAALAGRTDRTRLHHLDDVWRDIGPAIPESVGTVCHVGWDPVAVPQAVHRLNTLFYNPEVLERAGVTPEEFTTIRDLASDPEPLPGVGTQFASPMRSRRDLVALWESLLSARLAFPGQYVDLVTGAPSGSEITIRRTTADFDAALSMLPGDDRAAPELLDAVIGGTVGFVRAPTTAARHLVEKEGAAYGENWAAAPVFASPRTVTVVVEGFAVPRATAERSTPRSFVRFATRPGRSRQFSETYGSLPARVDVVPGGHPFYAEQARQYRAASIHPASIAYGQALRPATRERITRALVAFREHRDVARASEALFAVFGDARGL